MSVGSLIPYMSSFEPAQRSDGSVDPLGLQADAGRLADLLLPGFTVRMERARALTLSLAAVHFGQELAPSLEQSTHCRLSVERFFLDALITRVSKTTDPPVRGFPGRMKAWNARQRGERLTLDRYVKSPVTNGLVGVYATLAQSGRLFNGDFQIDSRGFELLDAWQHDGVNAVSSAVHSNTELRSRLQKAVRKDIDVKDRRFEPGLLRDLLFPLCRFDRIKARERQILHAALHEPENHPQPLVLSLLRKHLGAAMKHEKRRKDVNESERLDRGRIEREVMRRWASLDGKDGGAAVAVVARTALVFEELSQYLTAAFDAFRWTCTGDVGKPAQFEAASRDRRIQGILKNSVEQLSATLRKLEEGTGTLCAFANAPQAWGSKRVEIGRSVDSLITAFRGVSSPSALLEALVARHEIVQRQKQKATWYLPQDGGYRFFGRYLLPQKPAPSRDFLHAYRLVNAARILEDVEN